MGFVTAPQPLKQKKASPMSHPLICTCSHTPVDTATIDPPDLILDPWCPIHGKDPDEEYERRRDDERWFEDNFEPIHDDD
jgi:hypothetical protein